MRMAISSEFVGGAGGVERAVYSTAQVLDDCEISIFAGKQLGGELMELGEHVQIAPRWRFTPLAPGTRAASRGINRATRSIQRAANGNYDLLLHYGANVTARPYLRAHVAALVLAGADPGDVRPDYDYLLAEAPLDERHDQWSTRVQVLPPPLFPLCQRSELPPGIPSEFLLTVMNPWGAVKGADILQEFARQSPLPIVWCMSNQTLSAMSGDIGLPDCVHTVINASHGQLRALYEDCVAYVSFSRDEGFGWAIADAYQFGAPIVSRRVGLLRLDDLDFSCIELYNDPAEIVDLLKRVAGHRFQRRLGALAPEAFRARISALVQNTLDEDSPSRS